MAPTVWIIDDDLVSQFATEYCIRQANSSAIVKSFDKAPESLQTFQECIKQGKGMPQVILLDLVMPEMDGWEFLAEIEKLVGWEDKVSVYIISAFAKSKDRDLAKTHPLVRGYFDKPLSKVSADKIFSSVKV
ncbi:response regulator [Maribacter algarum]|uniref:Response regulator n=1 Tax=Maribacter algarum (ex Zhang et al. 2020) TaxID=2578118 RepID=A0A5S3PQA8_9FLAO|nr:response regulator [Maribacter algarum]TMM56874.1 response regulator [Maribacter algarum]